jgi:MarR family 2-MHQ and catechol resistance regulon transcriptional repressor
MTRAAGAAASPADDPYALDRAAARRLLVVMSRALRSVTAPLRQHLKQWDLSATEFGVLEALYHKGPLPLGELAERMLVTGASTTYTVKRLEERGLLRRRPCAEDQRFVFGELTEAGRALVAEIFPAHAEEIRRAMRGLTRQEKRDAAALLIRLERAVTTTSASSTSAGDEADVG